MHRKWGRVIKFTGLFYKYLISYLIVLCIPAIAGYVSYRVSIAETQTISIENSVLQLQKSQETLESRMSEVEAFTRQLAINQDLNSLMHEAMPEEQANIHGIWKLNRDITAISRTNNFFCRTIMSI